MKFMNQFNSDRQIQSGKYPSLFYAGLINQTNAKGGMTLSFRGKIESRFAVAQGTIGIKMTLKEFNQTADLETLLDEKLKLWDRLSYDGFGLWIDREDPAGPTVYIDPVDFIGNLSTALLIAKHRRELAIFDMDEKREIRLDRI